MAGRGRIGIAALAMVGLSLCAQAADPPQSGSDKARTAGDKIVATPRTVAEVGRSRVIAFSVAGASRAAFSPPVAISPDGVVDLLAPPTILEDESIGYLRVRGRAVGVATLDVGGTRIVIDVVEPRVADSDGAGLPRVVGPSAEACVWGEFAVGVERRVEPLDAEGTILLELPGGRRVQPLRVSDESVGPDRRAVFELDGSSLGQGLCVLTPVVTFEGGREVKGAPVEVRVVEPGDADLTRGEAEARYEVQRPQRFQESRVTVGRSEDASGGAYFNNFGSYPAVCFPVRVERGGWYQVFVRAMGTLAGGELPWIDVVVDGAPNPSTGGPLVSMRWHRLAVGTPIWLDPGTRIITPYFANDFYVQDAADRNLLIDTVEVARVGPVGATGTDPDQGGLVIPSLDAAAEGGGSMGGMTGGMARSMGGAMAAAMGGGGAMHPGGLYAIADPMGLAVAPVRIALDQVLEGRALTGGLLVEGQAWTPSANGQMIAPDVELLVNGRVLGRQRTFAPRFLIDADEFEDGVNTIQLTASVRMDTAGSAQGAMASGVMGASPASAADVEAPSGVIARTPVQTVSFARPTGATRGTRTQTLRFGIHDPGWDAHTRELFRSEHYPRERTAVGMYSRESIRLTLPPQITGRFRVGVEALGTAFEGEPELSIRLESAREGPIELGAVSAGTWWDTRFVDPIVLPQGPKSLVVTFTNDRYQAGAGDRNVWIQSLVLREASDEAPDSAAPVAALAFPREGDEFWMAGAVVAEACDDRGVERVELVVDGVETGVRRWVRDQAGPVVLPLLARALDPGEHVVSVRAYDAQGNIGESTSATIRVLERAPESDGGTEYDRAVTMLDRFAFGPDDRELAAILAMGRSAWLRDRLSRRLDDPGEQAALGPGLIWFEDGRYEYGPPRRALEHAFYTPNPARARFVLWAENHFSTWLRKAEGDRKWREHAEFARLGVAPFRDLLLASARSPAMLRYLDQDQSFAGRLNENYAREIMELHTLGVHGGYTQTDVTNLASVLTGWTAATLGDGQGGGGPRGFTFRFDPSVSSGEATRVLGVAFPAAARGKRYDRALLAIETLAAHPSTARHVATRLCESYAASPAPEQLVDAMAAEFERTDGDLAAVLVAMSEHPAFWEVAMRRRMTTPLDYALRLARGTGYHHPWRISEYLQLAGFQVFDRSTPDGYPAEDEAYGDSNAMIQRWSLAQDAGWALANLVPDPWKWDGAIADRAWAQRVVDSLAIGLTGRVLSERSNQAAIDLLLTSDASVSQRVQMIAPVVAQMPEANLK